MLRAGTGVLAAKSGVVGVSDASGVSRPAENFCLSFRFAKSFALSSDKLSFGSAGGGGGGAEIFAGGGGGGAGISGAGRAGGAGFDGMNGGGNGGKGGIIIGIMGTDGSHGEVLSNIDHSTRHEETYKTLTMGDPFLVPSCAVD